MDDAIRNVLLDKKSSLKVKQNVLIMFSHNTSPNEFLETLNKYKHIDPDLVSNIENELNTPRVINKKHIFESLKPPVEYLFYSRKTECLQPKNIAKRIKTNDIGKRVKPNNNEKIETSNKSVNEELNLFNLFFMNFSLQCKICGFRFDATEEGKNKFTLHVDNHSRKERALENAKSVSRDYFCSLDEFISNINKLELEVKTKEVQYYKAENSVCDVCSDKIGVEWNDEMDDWVMVDCVCIDERKKKYCHRKCII